MTSPIRWGILGSGRIAGVFAEGIVHVEDAQLLAIGSRSQEKADSFGDKYSVPRRYASYEALLADPDIDAIYVATPHTQHKECTIAALRAGKAVLCEKPFAINAAQTREMLEVARQEQRFVMEAMWTRLLPLLAKVRELVAEGTIGELRMLEADFGFRSEVNPKSRLYDPALGGGALLDVGVYPVSLAHMLFGKPTRIASMANIGETGIDEQAAMLLGFAKGEMALLSTAVRTNTAHAARIFGTKGSIELHSPWWAGDTLTLKVGEESQTIKLEKIGNGFCYEIAEVGRCIRAGKLESNIIPHSETLAVMETLDALRAQWGLKYPME
jgi:Predicted dehydrogenases and related proteins